MPLGAPRGSVIRRKTVPDLISNGLTSKWLLDEGSGQVVNDTTGNGHDGELGSTSGVDANDPSWVVEGLEFDGDDFVVIILTPGVTETTAWTCGFVFHSGTVVSFETLFIEDGHSSGNARSVFQRRTSNNTLHFRITDDAGDNLFAGQLGTLEPFDGGWHYLVVRRDGTSLELTVDGSKETDTLTPQGTITLDDSGGFSGAIGTPNLGAGAKVMLGFTYGRRLTDAEVEDNRNRVKVIASTRGVTLP